MPFYKCSVLISKLKELYSYEDVLKSALLVIIVTYIGQWPPTVPLKLCDIILILNIAMPKKERLEKLYLLPSFTLLYLTIAFSSLILLCVAVEVSCLYNTFRTNSIICVNFKIYFLKFLWHYMMYFINFSPSNNSCKFLIIS